MNTDSLPWSQWDTAAGDEQVDRELRQVYDDLAQEIEQRQPTCWISGKCCKFETYGHRLYVTGLEIAWMLRQLDPVGRQRLQSTALPQVDSCPFQAEGLCSVQSIKPLGCRIFFCDPSAESWLNDLYEQFLARLRQLHDARALDYRYVEWRQGLAEARQHLIAKR